MKNSPAILLSILLICSISYADEQEHFYGEWRERYEEWMKNCGASPTIHTFSPNRYKQSSLELCDPYRPSYKYYTSIGTQTSVIQTWHKTKDGYVLYFDGGLPLPFLLAKTKNNDIIIMQLLVDIFGNPGEPTVLYRIKR
jgi:hypothetical protein